MLSWLACTRLVLSSGIGQRCDVADDEFHMKSRAAVERQGSREGGK